MYVCCEREVTPSEEVGGRLGVVAFFLGRPTGLFSPVEEAPLPRPRPLPPRPRPLPRPLVGEGVVGLVLLAVMRETAWFNMATSCRLGPDALPPLRPRPLLPGLGNISACSSP